MGTIDNASKSIILAIIERVCPLVTNVGLMVHELQSTLKFESIQGNTEAVFSTLLQSSLRLQYKVDESLSEARNCRERMLLYLQFVKELIVNKVNDVHRGDNNEEASQVGLLKMLDPRVKRAMEHGRNSQAEVVTGSHLYSFLREQYQTTENERCNSVSMVRDRNTNGNFALNFRVSRRFETNAEVHSCNR